MAEWASVAGIVQFDPDEVTTNAGQEIRRVRIRSVGSQKIIGVTLWEHFRELPVRQGDFLFVDGQLEERSHEGNTYYNLSAKYAGVVPGVVDPGPKTDSKKPAQAKY